MTLANCPAPTTAERIRSTCVRTGGVRLPFREPVDDVSGLSRAIRVLMGCPFVNGLRARRD